jgi:hypothetical protein
MRPGMIGPHEVTNLAFTKLAPSSAPSAAAVFGLCLDLVTDPGGGTLLLVGGDAGSGTAIAQQWHYTEPSGTPTWTSISSTHTPWGLNGGASGIADMDLLFDPTSGNVIGFGGTAYATEFSTTLSWNGTDWSALSPGTVPAARTEYVLAADPVTGHPFMVAGWPNSPFTNMLADHYTWSGTNWVVFSGSKPSARAGYAMATDPVRGISVLFGGHNGSNTAPFGTILSDTWIWNGTAWSNPSPATVPTARNYVSMYYDPGLRMCVMYGGSPATNGDLSDAWGWNGANWVKLDQDFTCEIQGGSTFVYAPKLAKAIGFGGWPGQNGTPFAETWSAKSVTPEANPSVVQYNATVGPTPIAFILAPTE